MSKLSGFLTGFAQSLDKYMGMSNQFMAEKMKTDYTTKATNEAAVAKEQRELENQKTLKEHDASLDLRKNSALKAFELTLAGKVSPEAATEMFPEAAEWVTQFRGDNGRDPTMDEYSKGIDLMYKRNQQNKERLPKEFQFKAAGYYKRAMQGHTDLANLEKQFDATAYDNLVQGKLPQFLKGEKYRQFQQTRDNFITAYLRRDSGAAIAESEYTTADRQFFPVPGDTKKVLEQKARNRKGVIDSLKAEAEGKEIDLNIPGVESDNDPLGLGI